MPLAAGEPIIELKTNILCLCKKNNFFLFYFNNFYCDFIFFFNFYFNFSFSLLFFYLSICLVIFHLIRNLKHRRIITITRQGKLLVAKGLSEKKIEFHNRQLGVGFLSKN